MTTSSTEFDYRQLSVPQRIDLIGEIWDSIEEENGANLVSKAQEEELRRRLEYYREHPEEGSSWDEVEKRIRGASDR